MNKKENNEYFKKQILVSQSLKSSIRYYVNNALNEMKRRFCYFCLAFFSVTLVVTSAAVSQSVIDRAPIIFLQAAEGPVGEIDFTLDSNFEILDHGQYNSNQSFLNLTKIQEILNDDRSNQLTPRYIVVGESISDTEISQCQIDNSSELKMFKSVNNCFFYQQSTIYFLDQQQEQKIGVGRSWKPQNLNEDEVIIHKQMATQLGYYFIFQNQQQLIYYYFITLISEFNQVIKNNKYQKKNYIKYQPRYSKLVLPLTVKGFFEDSDGKFGDVALDGFIISEYKNLNKLISKYFGLEIKLLQNRQESKYLNYFKQINPYNYASYIIMNLKNRYDLYLDSNYDNIQYKVTSVSSNLVKDLGIYPIKIDMPILKELSYQSQASMFLGIILNLIVFVLFMLSVMLLYNLLLVSIETKNFEFGVLRVLGLNKFGVVCLIIFQSLFYVIPAVISGLLISIILLEIISKQLYQVLNLEISNTPTGNAFVLSLLLGIAIPLVSSIIPIREALKQTLGIALDQQRSKSQAIKIDIDIEGKKFPWGVISFSLITSIFGISIYYLLPLALLSLDFALLIAIFFWILVGLLVGFTLFALNVQHLLEKFVIIVFFFWTKGAIRIIIQKNLAAHRIKNRRTATMYGLSIAFIIFVWTAMSVQIDSSDYQIRRQRGVYMEVTATLDYLDTVAYENIISSQLIDSIESYSWVSDSLDFVSKQLGIYFYYIIQIKQLKKGYQKNYVTHIGRIYEFYPNIVAVSPNYLKTVFSSEFLDIYQSSNSGLDIVEELYTPRGSQSMILGKSQIDVIGVDLNYTNPILNILYNNTFSKTYQMRVSSIVNQMPGMTFSSIPSNQRMSGVVSFLTYMNFLSEDIQSYSDIPMSNLKLKIKSGKEGFVYDTLKKNMNEKYLNGKIWDYRDYQKSNQQQKKLINLIFSVLAIIVMALCFFSLVSSMTANIFEQTKEIAVLRAVGLTKFRMKTIYIFEAFTLVFSSCIMGICIGIIIGFTMSMQRALFTELPIKFTFPYQVLIVIFIASIICAYLSTFIPSNRILKKQISSIIRMTN
ncbi:hypothetical protein IMG5_099480 [Ichthyophthirius multifiliis]|uniref:ABC3 transporter permease C-terminal domain-containing protein n=1 Tax=Ichthyophthirius multifiliis TaxID=5932 RepID=G0QS55_ICHMU|nr:hypothetical protein IMG5_099480 [Ichthyophthirius multifiliis]EGR31920.1 hypothetical protein IMG5_099480 [Ichthyophthirius multifiliis]|eukprot:XP_004035406.1 hypothetical protein IMG5_099480 [Ichthyophthirius multifiliis]